LNPVVAPCLPDRHPPRRDGSRSPTIFGVFLLILLFTSTLRPLSWTHGTVIGVYFAYLLPYIAASYYKRYAVPLLAMKALLVLWAIDRMLWMRR
jgi:hypothetical protein